MRDQSTISVDFADTLGGNGSCQNPGPQDNRLVTIKNVSQPEFTDSSPVFIACGSGSRVFSVDELAHADHYVWTLPSGFTANSTTTTTNSITVNYTATASGQLKVKGRVDACNFNGPQQSLTITRTPPRSDAYTHRWWRAGNVFRGNLDL